MVNIKKLNKIVNNDINALNTELQITTLLLNKLINAEIEYINLNADLLINDFNKILKELK